MIPSNGSMIQIKMIMNHDLLNDSNVKLSGVHINEFSFVCLFFAEEKLYIRSTFTSTNFGNVPT